MNTKIKSFVQWGILVIAVILGISLIKSITKIAGSNQKITDAQSNVNVLKKENEVLTKQLQAAESTQFIEQQARDKLGLAKKGEIVVVLPDEKILRSLAPKLDSDKVTLPDPNWKLWLKLFVL